MYDIAYEVPDRSGKVKRLRKSSVTDFSALSTPEVSFDLHGFIGSYQNTTEDVLFADILAEDCDRRTEHKSTVPAVPYVFPMPKSAGFGPDRFAAVHGVKQEPDSEIVPTSFGGYSTSTYAFAGLPNLSDGALSPASSERDLAHKKSKKPVDKASDEYRRRRERNNIAVRKSREKAKQTCKDTEKRVNELVSENNKLRKRVELFSKELSVLKNLLSNVGVSPESIVKNMGQ